MHPILDYHFTTVSFHHMSHQTTFRQHRSTKVEFKAGNTTRLLPIEYFTTLGTFGFFFIIHLLPMILLPLGTCQLHDKAVFAHSMVSDSEKYMHRDWANDFTFALDRQIEDGRL